MYVSTKDMTSTKIQTIKTFFRNRAEKRIPKIAAIPLGTIT